MLAYHSHVLIEGSRPGALKISKRPSWVESESKSHHVECVFRRHWEGYTFCQKKDNRIQIRNAASNQPFESESEVLHSKNYGDSVKSFLDAFYRFSRPHTVIGTVTFKNSCPFRSITFCFISFFVGKLFDVAAALCLPPSKALKNYSL